MRIVSAFVLFLTACLPAAPADWLNSGGDPQHTRWQKREKLLTPSTVSRMRLLWARQLTGPRAGLSSPVILGHMITHRGTVELIFAADKNGDVYAIDADLGKVFWRRHLAVETSRAACADAASPTPAIAPAPANVNQDEEDEDAPQPLRPLYVLSSGGRLHALHPGDGRDLSAPWILTPPHARAADLNLISNSVSTTTSGACGGIPDGAWSVDVGSPGAKALFQPAQASAIPSVFTWMKRQWTADTGNDGRVVVADGRGSILRSAPVKRRFQNGLATPEDAAGRRWIYAGAGNGPMVAFRLDDRTGRPALTPVWTSRALIAAAAPVAAGGLIFALSRGESGGHATLYAFDAATGKQLYSSGNAIAARAGGDLAVANGHVCFTTVDGSLYCFGFPVDI